MGLIDRSFPWRTKAYGATFFPLSAFTGAWLVRSLQLGNAEGVVTVCVVGLVVASVLLFFRPRLDYSIAVLSGLVALYWFSRLELANFPALNSWILFNLPDTVPSVDKAQPRIAFGAALIASSVFSLNALLPAKWCFRGKAVRERLWPPFAIALAIVAFWYFSSVSPYRVPIFSDGPRPELAILHIQKDGLQFNETMMSVYRDGNYYYSRNNRTLFQYEFATQGGNGILPGELFSEVQSVAVSPSMTVLRTFPATALRAWRAEGWYVYSRREPRLLAFTTENRMEPPKQVVDLFRKLVALPPVEKPLPAGKDVCFGFCYDPQAGLQMANMNDRCWFNNGTSCE